MKYFNFIFIICPVLFVSCAAKSINVTSETNNYIEGRIIGGEPMYQPVPYQISFQRRLNGQWRHFCSGAIISPNFFLTAAHCVVRQNISTLSVFAGVTNLQTQGSRHFIQSLKIHEEFVPLWKCDIAVVKVSNPFVFNGVTINAISFTNTTMIPGGTTAVLTGWGSTGQFGTGPFPDNLQILTTTILSNRQCLPVLPNMRDTELCTFRSRTKGGCNGDSGGPLVDYEREILYGLLAFGTNVCANGYPDFYTRIAPFVGWILRTLMEL